MFSLQRSLVSCGRSGCGATCTGAWSRVLPQALPATSKDIQRRDIHEVQGDVIPINMVKGIGHLRDPRLNKGLAFTLEERIALGIHGLQPPRFKTQEEQLALCKASVMKYTEDLNRYLYLVELQKISRVKPYDIIDMEKAVQVVKKGSSVLSASKMFKIPYATLHSRVTGKYDLNVKPGPSSIFSAEEEKELVDWILELSKRGFPVTKEHLLDSVQCIVRKTKKITPFTNGRPSKHWYKAFMRRHPQLSEKVSQSLNKSRANVTENNLKNWFSQIEQYLLSNNAFDIEPDRVFNLDETAFLLNPKCGKVLVKKGEKSVYNVCHNDKECYTALIGGNASGQLLPTMVVFSYERIPVLVAKHFPEDFVLGKSESGWMTSETFFSYVANHLYQWCLNNKIKFPIVVYVDGHSSHLAKALSDFCVEKGIILIALFPNATHIMQPMDVALFHPLKCSYKNAVRIWRIDNNGQFLTKVFFASVLKIAVNELDIKKIFKSGFRKCGLYPFSENAIDYSKFMKNYECDNITPQREQHSENLCNVSHEEPMNFIELNINPAILSDFKANECIEWKGDIEFTELFNFWLRCKNKVNNNLNTEKSAETLKETIEISSVNDLENIDIIELPVIAHGDINNEEIVLSNIIEVSSTVNTENLYVVELPCIEDNVIDNDFIDSSTISDVCEMSDTSTTNHKILDDKLNINIDKDACDKVFVDKERNERLFFRLLKENIEQMMPIVYTPTVGLACQKFGVIYRRPRGLFITIYDKGHIYEVLNNWPEQAVRAICVTDGERILGLGDLGACGMGIPVGKLALYTALAGIKPHQCLPITIDVGTNNEQLRNDPHYIGLNKPRTVGPEYDELLDEFMWACVKKYGQNVLIQFEDFGNHNAFRFLDKYRNKYCTFNDDIQGTAAVAVAGVLASQRITQRPMRDNKFVFLGAGEAAIGIADLCVRALEADGCTREEARNNIWMMDIDGLLTTTRTVGDLDGHKAYYAKDVEPMKNLIDVVKKVKPSILIGASAAANTFTSEVLREMANNNDRPLIFALSNPTSKAECTATAAYENTDGRCIFSSGSPFGEINYKGKIFKPGQGNNAYIFPGIALGVIATGCHHITEDMFLLSAQEVANKVSDEDLAVGSLYPPLGTIQECSLDIACKIADYAYRHGNLASEYPEPKDKREFIMSKMYNCNYDSPLPNTYTWPVEYCSPRTLPENL